MESECFGREVTLYKVKYYCAVVYLVGIAGLHGYAQALPSVALAMLLKQSETVNQLPQMNMLGDVGCDCNYRGLHEQPAVDGAQTEPREVFALGAYGLLSGWRFKRSSASGSRR